MLRLGKKPPVRRVNVLNDTVKKKKKVPSKYAKFWGGFFVWGVFIGVIVIVVAVLVSSAYSFVLKTKKPNAQLFSACPNTFIQIKAKPQFGIIFDVEGDTLDKITLTSPESAVSLKSIQITGRSWFVVYFSNNFTFTQSSEFLRLSKLEKGNLDYCYLMEQISLTSGVPIEYVIVRENGKITASSVSEGDAESLVQSVKRGTVKEFRESLLPLYKLDDGTSVPVITYSAFQEQFPTFFRIEDVASEQAFVEVYNATTISGYANIVARKWNMLGIDVSRINNATYPEITTDVAVIYVKKADAYYRTLDIIKSSLPPGNVVIKEGRPSFMVTTGDIVVFLLKR